MKKALGFINSPFTWLAVMLLTLEVLARQWVPYLALPRTAEECWRNPYRMRGWPEYLSNERPADRRLVIVIGNSQGYSPEIAETGIYTAVLQRSFDEQGLRVQVENWCMPGATMVDHHLLFYKALEKRPDVLVFMKTFEDFVLADEQKHLDYTGMDVDLVAADPGFLRSLWSMSLELDITANDLIKRALMRRLGLARARIHVLDLASAGMEDRQLFLLLFGHDIDRQTFFIRRPASLPLIVERRRNGQDRVRGEQMDAKLRLLPFFLKGLPCLADDVRRETANMDTRVVWCWNPVVSDYLGPDRLRRYRSACAKGDEILRQRGIDPVDLRDAVPIDHFYTYSHFEEGGHAVLAGILEPLILNALGEDR